MCNHINKSMNENLKVFIEQTIKSLEYIKNNGAKEYSFEFDCSELEDFSQLKINVLEHPKTKPFYAQLKEIKGPVLYWFEIVSGHNPIEIVSALSRYEGINEHRTIPKIRKKFCVTSDCLYVGKVKRSFYNRLMQHLGYFTTPTTQGLQLYYWAKELHLKVRLHAIEFEREMEDMMPAVEQYFANTLKPLVGKHI